MQLLQHATNYSGKKGAKCTGIPSLENGYKSHFRRTLYRVTSRRGDVRETSTKWPYFCPYLHTEYLSREHRHSILPAIARMVNHCVQFSEDSACYVCRCITRSPPLSVGFRQIHGLSKMQIQIDKLIATVTQEQ